MAIELSFEKWQGEVAVVNIGATKQEGGTRSASIPVGGEKTLPFLSAEGAIAHRPVVAFEIWDIPPADWPEGLSKHYQDVWKDPFAWAKKCVSEYKAQLLCVRLQGTHPDSGDKKPQEAAKFITQLLKTVSVPLIIIGSDDDPKDNLVLPACSEAAKGERCLIGSAVQDNYKTITAAVLADGHALITESPIDINIAKQLNILVSDMGLPLERIVIDPTIGALGYGLEYAYSIMERARLACLSGDKILSSPFICFVGQEAWKTKEAKAPASEFPAWGKEYERGIMWEAVTATALLQAGADILVMRHPEAIAHVNTYIETMLGARAANKNSNPVPVK
jgi:acetyl-CoA decarbonylase/synthase complex subunit delta